MLKELFATVLLLHGCSSNSLNCLYADSNECNDSNIVERLETPYYAPVRNGISGAYNFRNTFNFTGMHSDVSVHFEDEHEDRLVPFFVSDNSSVMYLRYISFEESLDENEEVDSIYLYFSYYAYDFAIDDYTDFDFGMTISNGYTIDDLPSSYRALMFNVTSTFLLDEDSYFVFNEIFTYGDNLYVTSYEGYYNFNYSLLTGTVASDTTWQPLSVLGAISWQYRMFRYMSIFRDSSYGNTFFDLGYFDTETTQYTRELVGYNDIKNTYANSLNNLYFGNVKMTVTNFNRLASVGVFGFQRSASTEPETFHDLLFTIMDVPVYFITQFFNFELFGMNLYVAFAGLVTLAVAIFIIRIIWKF